MRLRIDLATAMRRALWMAARLSCMSPREVLHRAKQFLVARAAMSGLLRTELRCYARPDDARQILTPPRRIESESYIADANLLLSGKVVLFADREYAVGSVPDWNRDPLTGVRAPHMFGQRLPITDRTTVGDIKYLWELNRHLHFVRLAQAYSLSRKPEYREALAHQLASWLDQCPPLVGPNWSSPLEAGIRLISWSLTWEILGGWAADMFVGDVGERLRDRWLASISAHCIFIKRNLSRYSSANNHLIGEAAGLYVAAVTWPCWSQSVRWRNAAQAELEREAVKQHASDGVNREQAFSYQIFVAQFLLLAGIYGLRTGRNFSATYWEVIQRSNRFLKAVRDFSGTVPAVGDSDDGVVFHLQPRVGPGGHGAIVIQLADTLSGSSRVGSGCETASWLLEGAHELRPIQRSLDPPSWFFSEGGYFLFGSDFGTRNEVKGLVDCGPVGYLGIAAHGHADALALLLTIGGEECLIDSGTFSYWSDARWRNYFRGTSAHNTVRVDRMDQSVRRGRFMWTRKASARLLQAPVSPDQFEFVGSHDGYSRLRDSVQHVRRVTYDGGRRALVVYDELFGTEVHEFEQFWHFAPHIDVNLNGAAVKVRGRNFAMEVEFLGADLSLECVTGVETPPLGWYSRMYDVKQPCSVVVVRVLASAASIRARFSIQ